MQYSAGQVLDGRYELVRFVGSGSFGEVWVANDKATDLEVAIKIYVSMDEQGLSDFKKEFQITFDFNHTNLLHANYLGVNAGDRRPYLVMPFCPDGSVSKYAGKMAEEDIWRFIRDVAAGLAYLHSRQPPVIHQDIKPDNILILRNGDFVITDFGISKQLRASLRKSAMSSANGAGSISYMGPERFSKQYQAVKASDIWSVGASIYELAVGDLPFCGMGGSLQKKGADMPELSDDDFSPTLNMVMQACLAKEPWNRPTALQLSEYANRVLQGETPPPSWGRKPESASEEAAMAAPQGIEGMYPQPQSTQFGRRYPQPFPPGPVQMQPQPQMQSQYPEMQPAVQGNAQNGYPSSDKPQSVQRIPGWLWALVAVVGMAAGFLINMFV